MNTVYIAKLYLKFRFTDVKAQKMDSLYMKIFKIIIANFLVFDKLGKACSF